MNHGMNPVNFTSRPIINEHEASATPYAIMTYPTFHTPMAQLM